MSYRNISAAEMRQFLRADKGWTEFNSLSHEIVYICPIPFMPKGIVLKLYTGINKHNEQSRRRGGDAIRVCVVEGDGHGRGLLRTAHVKRVDNWRDNLKNRIRETYAELRRSYAHLITAEPPQTPHPQDDVDYDPREDDEGPDPADMAEDQALGLAYRRITGTQLPWES